MIMVSYTIIYLLFITGNVCNELCPFYQLKAASVPPTNTNASQGKSGISSRTIVAIVVPISVAVLIFIVGICYFNKRTRDKDDSEFVIEVSNVNSLKYDFRTIETATNKFSADNKIGSGGFGEVYKGMLANGQEIAVKTFSRASYHGIEEFKNEVEVLAKVQHRNLVRLLGFCVQREENMLIYEYATNKSLDSVIFDLEKKRQLEWAKRYKIIKGIARGIQYLHDDSRLKIIHRDIKASGVLLDNDMTPKITDFGLAKIFTFDQMQGNCDVAGTFCYIAPEHYMTGDFSVKSDVFSFGSLLLEIISGKKIISRERNDLEAFEHWPSIAWRLWKEGEALELVDPTIRECCNPNEVMRCIHIALLCVQYDPTDRPSMSSIILMLERYPLTLPSPSDPTNSTS